MKGKSMVIAMVLLTFWLTAATVTAQTLQPVDALILVDSTGKKLGNVLSVVSAQEPLVATVGFSVNGRPFLVTVNDAWVSSGGGLYTSTDCTGTFYGSPQTGELMERAAVGPSGMILYLPDLNAKPQTITVMSLPQQPFCSSVRPFLVANVVPYVQVADLSTQFTPPFHLVPASTGSSASCCGDCNGNGQVTVDEILTTVNNALNGCP
jgi:hypothetical protein